MDLIWSRWGPHRHTLGITSTNLCLVEVPSPVLQGTLCSGSQSTGFMWRLSKREKEKLVSEPLQSPCISPSHKLRDGWVTSAPTGELPTYHKAHVHAPDAGKEWRQEEKRAEEDEMVRQRHWLKGHEFEHPLGHRKGQESLSGCSPRGRKESNTT